MNSIDTKYPDQFTTLSSIAKVLPIQTYNKLETNSLSENNDLKFFIKKTISLGDNVGYLSTVSSLDYAIFNCSEPIAYISFILNSRFGFNSLGKINPRTQIVSVSLDRIKETIIPLNDYMDDCCYFEKIHTFIINHYLGLGDSDNNKDTFLFFIDYLYCIKSYMILEMFKPEIFKKFQFSLLEAWRFQKEMLKDEKPNLSLVNNLLHSLFSQSNELISDIDKLSAIGNYYDFSPIV